MDTYDPLSEQSVKQFLASKKSQILSKTVLNAIEFLKTKQYLVQKLINCGGFGLVFQVLDTSNKNVVAIKLLITQDKTSLDEVQKEFKNSKQFNHPNINKCHTQIYDDINETLFIVSEFCTFGDLSTYLQQQELTKGEITKIMKNIIQGMMEIHSKNLIHSDMKPQNILIGNNLNFQICDFGLSKLLSLDKSQTMANGLTYFYSPLEQDEGNIKLESDIYSLGSILLFLCRVDFCNFKNVLNLKNGNFEHIKSTEFEDLLQIAFKMMHNNPKQRLKLIDSFHQFDSIFKILQSNIQNKDGQYQGELQNNKRHGLGTQIYNQSQLNISYNGSWRNDQKEGLGHQSFKNGNSYVGWWKNNQMHGKGILSYSDGNRYEGEFINDKREGYGILYYSNGNRYEGNFQNGFADGKGTLICADGEIYKGDYKYSKRNGQGILLYSNGNRYEGDFKDDKRDGKGILYYSNGTKYEGEFKDGFAHGKGTFFMNNKDKYVGEFINSKKEGMGILYYFDGNRYEGDFKDDKRDGKGILYYSDGASYDGEFKNGFAHGKGIFLMANKDKYVGEFINSKREGTGILYYFDGNRYEGDFKDDKRNGKGILYYSNGAKYEGEFKNGFAHGKGTFFMTNKDKYVGEFISSKKEGQGIIYYSNGSRFEGEFKNDEKLKGQIINKDGSIKLFQNY